MNKHKATLTKPDCFIDFKTAITNVALPEKFTFPFYYTPHPLAIQASKELQDYLEDEANLDHNFGLDENNLEGSVGKMFGVLVVKNEYNEIGYLAGFSGKIAEKNILPNFVPPVFDILTDGNFFNIGMAKLNKLSAKIKLIEDSKLYKDTLSFVNAEIELSKIEIEAFREKMREAKKLRKEKKRQLSDSSSKEEIENLNKNIARESFHYKHQLRELVKSWETKLNKNNNKLASIQNEIDQLKAQRSIGSNNLQQQIFEHYSFLNYNGESKNLADIFNKQPPIAGAGECAAPKLLQFAYENNLKPIALAEFWWGIAPNSQIRKHKHYYPACRGKCEPILGHMLQGLIVDDNPLLKNPGIGKVIETVYEDQHLLVINKPHEFFSVPGKTISDSVATRMKKKYPEATGPLIVHRLDMSTSGLILIAKSSEVYVALQKQFVDRTIKKRYVALLEGTLKTNTGEIDLPLRVDLNDRPKQVVCYEHGKNAKTGFEIINRKNKRTRVYFYPITGRTHQLRMHAAHPKGLNMPIVGDDLYGTKSKRLCLHAEMIEFTHPITNERLTIQVDPNF